MRTEAGERGRQIMWWNQQMLTLFPVSSGFSLIEMTYALETEPRTLTKGTVQGFCWG